MSQLACASDPIASHIKLPPIQQLQQSESQRSQVPGMYSDLCMRIALLDAPTVDLEAIRQPSKRLFQSAVNAQFSCHDSLSLYSSGISARKGSLVLLISFFNFLARLTLRSVAQSGCRRRNV